MIDSKKIEKKTTSSKKTNTQKKPKASRLKVKYTKEIVPSLRKKFEYNSIMEVPKLQKIVVNMGVGKGLTNKAIIIEAEAEMAAITGQKPIHNIAKKSIAAFKVREGMPTGVKATLRGDRMYEFLDKLITITLPRTRDFRGLSPKSFDGEGNYSLGIKEHIVFTEIDFDKVKQMKGCDISIVTNTTSNKEAFELLKLFGLPFRKGGHN